ncbi:MAG: hypothetical protein NW226_18725 [Microscillaceae bacterium]|nr:hypothetical protein [Microscillaceae bacterium]
MQRQDRFKRSCRLVCLQRQGRLERPCRFVVWYYKQPRRIEDYIIKKLL